MPNPSPRRTSVALGLVGCAAAWEDSYREVIRRQTKPVRVAGVYHPVPALAEQSARDWHGWAAPSLTRLFERGDIDAVVLLDPAWQGWYALELAVRFRKPALVTGPWIGDSSGLEPIHLAARDAGVLIMAAFPRRHSPATNRLRELMATKLGPATRVSVEAPAALDQLLPQRIDWIDWCSSILGRPPLKSDLRTAIETTELQQIDLKFAATGLQADIVFQASAPSPPPESLRIHCRHGAARIVGEREIEWTVDGHSVREALPSDRSGMEIILDQFCRRVVGGLIPVADLGDLLRSARLAQQLE